MPNRLAKETSPYLLQHAENPIDWYPWGDEAFEKAKAENKPVFLSVGYSACHWCHVMSHESFEDAEVASILNSGYVCIKVDREELPDIDEAYMTAVQLTSGRGGWPMSVFLTGDRKPFFAGTYFPKENRGEHPGFIKVLTEISNAWNTRREALEQSAAQLASALTESRAASAPVEHAGLTPEFINQCVEKIASEFDTVNGGFGERPKFPPHSGLELFSLFALQPFATVEMREASLGIVAFTLQKMSLGGIHDQVGGGFHRYSTDAEWKLPHFEKMLSDNALMLSNLVRAAAIVEPIDPGLFELFMNVADRTIGWVTSEMTAPEGYFYAALDADTEGEEGLFYTWTLAEIQSALGDRAAEFAQAFNVLESGNFHDEATGQLTGRNVLFLTGVVGGEFDGDLEILEGVRNQRPKPGLDDKAIISWNGLMIGALADAGQIAVAEPAALAILAVSAAHGRLPHQITKGVPSGIAYLEDYANLIDGFIRVASLLELLEESGQAVTKPSGFWLDEAVKLTEAMIGDFYDPEKGGFFSTSTSHDNMFGRTKPVFDQPTPSGNAIAIRILSMLGQDQAARQSAAALMGWMERAPQATEALISTCLAFINSEEPAVEVVVPAEVPVKAPLVADVKIEVQGREQKADAKGEGHISVKILVPEGFHLNSPEPPARWLVPTRVETAPAVSTISYPPSVEDRYEGEVTIDVLVAIPAGNEAVEFEVKVSWQACTDSECLLATEKRFDCVVYR